MNLLNKLTIKNLKLNKKRTIVTVIGIMLSVALITAVANIYSSAVDSLIRFEKNQNGDFHVAFYDVPSEEIETFKNNRKIDCFYLTKGIGYARLKESKNEYKPYAYVKAFSKDALENLKVNIVEGRLPQNDGEVVIPTHLKTNGRIFYKVGDTIELEVGTRVSEGYELTQDNQYDPEGKEQITNTTTRKYKIVGIMERPSQTVEGYSAPGYTFITYMDGNTIEDKADVYVRFTKSGLMSYTDITASILGVDKELFAKAYSNEIREQDEIEEYTKEMEKAKYNIMPNQYLIILQTNPLEEGSVGELGVVASIICAIIVATSVFCIKNSFDISITEKIKQYGMLRSIGATKKQIRKNVFYEASLLGIIGVPLGILLGVAASFILVIVTNYYMDDMMTGNLKLYYSFSWIAVVAAVLLGIITLYLSAFNSARRAGKVSPIDSVRNSGGIKIKARKLRSPRIVNKIFGVGGDISYKNLKRNKKKYRTTVISIVVSVGVFISLSYFMSLAFKAVKTEFSTTDYNVSMSMTVESEDLYSRALETTRLDNIDDYSVFRQDGQQIEKAKYSEAFINYAKEMYTEEEIAKGEGDLNNCIDIVAIGEHQYSQYIKKLGLDDNKVKEKGILVNISMINKYDEKKDQVVSDIIDEFDYSDGDIVVINSYDGSKTSVELAKVTDIMPFGSANTYNSMLIVSDDMFDKMSKENRHVEIYYKSSNADKLQDDIDEVLKDCDYNVNNRAENVKMMENFYTLVGIFLYGFIIVISLIGITNIFNTITTNMELRKQEFAMLKSVGMTTSEFRRMIRLESVFMGSKSLIVGIPIGVALSYVIYYYLGKDMGFKFILPYGALIISILAVFILITCIMKYSMNKINKQNTIETIRNENI